MPRAGSPARRPGADRPLCDGLWAITGSPAVPINRAVAVVQTQGRQAGLAALAPLADEPRSPTSGPGGRYARVCWRRPASSWRRTGPIGARSVWNPTRRSGVSWIGGGLRSAGHRGARRPRPVRMRWLKCRLRARNCRRAELSRRTIGDERGARSRPGARICDLRAARLVRWRWRATYMADGRVDPEIGGCAAPAHVGAPAGRVSDPACRTLCGARRDPPLRESLCWL